MAPDGEKRRRVQPSTTDPKDEPIEQEPEQADIIDDIEATAQMMEDLLIPELTLAELTARATADPRALKDPVILAAMAALKKNDLIEYDYLVADIRKTHKGLKVETIHTLVDNCIKLSTHVVVKAQEVDPAIAQSAQIIINSGKAYEYIYGVWQKRVKGNEFLGRALIVSRGVQSCLNTKGVHIYAHGKHGHGKSEGMEKAIELVPPEYRMDEDVSPLAIHYASQHGMLLPVTTLLIDEMVWGDALAGIIKRIITRFQKGAGHLTVIDGVPVRVRTQPRLSIWTNSADMQADEQLRDRFLDVAITEGKEYVNEIMEFQKIRDTLPDTSEDVDRETEICQAILRDLAEHVFTTKITFSQKIKMATSEGTRGYNIFSDIVKGLAAMRYSQRLTNEKGQLLATEDDFKDAKTIYEGARGHSEESYTTSEAKVLNAIIDNGHKALYKDIKTITGMSEGRIKDIVNGRGKEEQKRHGLRYKCSQLDVNTVDISVVIAGTEYDRVTTHPVELSLPTTFIVPTGKTVDLVYLDHDVEERSPDVDPDVEEKDSNRDRDVEDVGKEERESAEEEEFERMMSSIPSLSLKSQKPTSTTSRLSPLLINATSAPTFCPDPLRQGQVNEPKEPLPDLAKSSPVVVDGVYQTLPPTEGKSATIAPTEAKVDSEPVKEPKARSPGECKDVSISAKDTLHVEEHEIVDIPTPDVPTASVATEDPEIARIRAGHQKYVSKKKCTCHICDRVFPYELTSDFDNGISGYICTTCHMEHRTRAKPAPVQADTQSKF